GATVADVDELDAGEAEVGDQRVGVSGRVAAAEGELRVGPSHPRVAQRLAGRVRALGPPAHAGMAAERVDPDADDGDISHATASSAASSVGANAKVETCSPEWPSWNGMITNSSGMPIRNCRQSSATRRDSTRISASRSTYPTPNGRNGAAAARYGSFGGKPCTVNPHSRPVRASRWSS